MEDEKKLSVTLGEKIKGQRESLGFSIKDLAAKLQTLPQYLEALEQENMSFFPAKVYALGFLKKLIGLINLGGRQEELLQEFNLVWDQKRGKEAESHWPPAWSRALFGFTVTPKILSFGIAVVILFSLLTFLGFRLVYFVARPQLAVEAPREGEIFETPLAMAKGSTQTESQLTVNGRELKIDTNGRFGENIELLTGVNTLEFLVQNRFGKQARVVRNVLVNNKR